LEVKMDMDITKLGERGQVVIPLDMRNHLKLKAGMKMLVIEEGGKLIFQPTNKIKQNIAERIREDIIDSRIAEKRLKEMESGEFIRQDADEFLKELEEWAKE